MQDEAAAGYQCFALDTDWVSQNPAGKRLDSLPRNGIFVSTVSLWEIATKASIGKLAADVTEIRAAIAASGFIELPVLGEHTETLASLPLHHRDPFDRMIVAQAITEPMRLLTGNSQLAAYSELVQTV